MLVCHIINSIFLFANHINKYKSSIEKSWVNYKSHVDLKNADMAVFFIFYYELIVHQTLSFNIKIMNKTTSILNQKGRFYL